MFDWLYGLLGTMLSFFSDITGSYVLALLMYALIFKVVLIPLTIKQQKNQVKMAALAPKIQLIKAKYKGRNDQQTMQKQQQEIMELQQKEGYNGCSGCLPLLIQLPIIMLLYTVIQNPISHIAKVSDTVAEYNDKYELSEEEYATPENLVKYYGDSLYTYDKNDGTKSRVKITKDMIVDVLVKGNDVDMSEKRAGEITIINKIYKQVELDPEWKNTIEAMGIKYDSIPNFRFLGTNLASQPKITEPSIIIIIPFLAALSSWLTMFLSRKLNGSSNPAATEGNAQMAQSMKIMDITMPLMTLFIAFGFSAMLGLYWIIQSALGLLQTFIMSRAMPIPRYTEEELKELRRQEKEVEKAARAAAKVTRHRSLHYIDEDDYDELPEAPTSESSKKNESFSGDAPEIKD